MPGVCRSLLGLLLLTLQACAGLPTGADPALADCVAQFERFDRQTLARRDGGAFAVAPWPQLATDRYLASFGADFVDARLARPADWRWWVESLTRLATEERRLLGERAGVASLPGECSERLNQALLADSGARARLARSIHAPDSYVTWQQLVGLYPIPALIAQSQIHDLHARLAAPFSRDPLSLPRSGRLLNYTVDPGSPLAAADWPELPAPPPDARPRDPGRILALVRRFAPTLSVDTVDANDRIGRMNLDAGGQPRLDPDQPTGYFKLSYTRFRGRSLLQISYHFWFPARPTDDIYGGVLDALVWRVTLDDQDRPLVYDSMHGCGCYYMVFPGPGMEPRPTPPNAEPVLFPRQAPPIDQRQRMVLHLASATHYLRQLDTYPRPGRSMLRLQGGVNTRLYRLRPYADLRRLALADGPDRASLFDADGLVPASARPERYLLWPLGVASAGAMRQWGRHATAFVGRRHFDDPFLFEPLIREERP